MKWILSIANQPIVIVLSALFGTAAISYMQATFVEVLKWLVPMVFIVMADLSAGVRAAKFRGETVRFSSASRRTLNKLFCYACWIFTCVALNERYDTQVVSWVGMGIVFLIEGTSFIGNVLEPRGYKLSLKGLLRFIGNKFLKADGLEDVIEKEKEQ